MNEVIEFEAGRLWLREDGLVHAVAKPGAEMTLADAREEIAVIGKIGRGKGLPLLVDFKNLQSQDRGARTYFAGEETAKAVTACAILISSPLSRVIGNFYMGLNKPVTPTKLFTSESEAIDWLKEFLE